MIALLVLALIFAPLQEVVGGYNKGPSGGGGFGTLRCSKTVDTGTVTTTAAVDAGCAATAGDLIVVGATSAGQTLSSICDSTTSGACGTSASTYLKGSNVIQGGGTTTVVAWTCNAAASARFITATFAGLTDSTLVVAIFAHNVTGTCADASASATSASAGATLTSTSYSTAAAQEIAFGIFADDSNSGPAWTGSAGSGFTLITKASSTVSMLGVGEYQVYSSTQSGVTASINTGNSSGHAVAFAVETFK